jgi:hypothetical protein
MLLVQYNVIFEWEIPTNSKRRFRGHHSHIVLVDLRILCRSETVPRYRIARRMKLLAQASLSTKQLRHMVEYKLFPFSSNRYV